MTLVVSFLVLITAALAFFVQWRLHVLDLAPVPVDLPPLGVFPTNSNLCLTGNVELIGVDDLIGPESLVSTRTKDGRDVMFTALGDGRIVRIEDVDKHGELSWITLVRTGENDESCGKGGPSDETNTEQLCGRPLGIKIVKRSTVDPDPSYNSKVNKKKKAEDEDVLVVADAYIGLLMISGIYGDSSHSQRHILSTRAVTDPQTYSFQLLNALVQTPDGTLYITETSQQIQRRRIFHAVLDGKSTGRLLKYTRDRGVEVVAEGLYMPNGIALSHDEQFLVIVSGIQVLKFSLDRQAIDSTPFIYSLYGTGDNIDAMTHLPNGEPRNCYWAAYGSKFAQPFSLLKTTSNKPILKSMICALVPYKKLINLIPKLSALAVYDEDGKLIEIFQDVNATAPWLSEGETMGEYLYLASWFNNFLARVRVGALK